ncbi:hypothetical protein T492DRAFT_2374 [Pavlovales sp. CCMP2436]|nr:hypothetical protein T492DRAFT_2374 [Pavlovales sp. CCMP2436]
MEGFLHANALSERDTYLWIDVFCLPQANVQAYVSRIGEIERRIGSVVMVLDPWIAPVCLTRVWCLYEVVHTVPSTRDAAGITFHLTLSSSERASFVTAYEKFGKQHIENVLAAFDARNAMATVEADKHMIFALIASTFDANEGFTIFRGRRSSSRDPSKPSSKRGSSAHSDCSGALALATPEDIVLDSTEAFVRFNTKVRVALMGALTGLSWQI